MYVTSIHLLVHLIALIHAPPDPKQCWRPDVGAKMRKSRWKMTIFWPQHCLGSGGSRLVRRWICYRRFVFINQNIVKRVFSKKTSVTSLEMWLRHFFVFFGFFRFFRADLWKIPVFPAAFYNSKVATLWGVWGKNKNKTRVGHCAFGHEFCDTSFFKARLWFNIHNIKWPCMKHVFIFRSEKKNSYFMLF